MSADSRRQSDRDTPSLGRLLIVDPDSLARWSLTAYLSRWFSVEAAESLEDATRMLSTGCVNALVVSDDLPATALDGIEEQARQCQPPVATIRTVTGVHGSKRPPAGCVRLEKPFLLADLARLLGVPEHDLATQSGSSHS
ncbi:MAG: hypothetical protein JXO22_18040 [Phycisphaerae bacterium]|nr:hypothetical protein [Phycisphaerae bacterium]